MTYTLSKNVHKLAFLLLFILPYIPVAVIWHWLSPVGFVQTLVMLFVCIFLYALCLIAELTLFVIFWS